MSLTRGVPRSLEEVTPEWLSSALGVGVASVEVHALSHSGLMSDIRRLALTYEETDVDLPSSFIIKMESSDEPTRAITREYGNFRRECMFYARLEGRVPGVAPRCYVSAHDEASDATVLILEDLSGQRIGDREAGISLPDMEVVLRTVARLHAQWWGRVDAEARVALPDFAMFIDSMTQLLSSDWGMFVERFGDLLPERRLIAIRDLATKLAPIADALCRAPETIIHCDLKPDNMMFDASGEVRLIDWAILRGPAIFDIALFLSACTGSDERRRIEDRLLRIYYDEICAQGVKGYSWQRCKDDLDAAALFHLAFRSVAGRAVTFPDAEALARERRWFSRSLALALDHDRWGILT